MQLRELCLPLVYNQQSGDEVFGLLRRVRKLRLIKVPLTGQDVIQGLIVVIAKERTETTETGRGKSDRCSHCDNVGPWMPIFVCLRVYSQHVSNDAEAPHVCVEGYKIVVDDLGSEKLWSAKIHPQFLPGFIPVAGDTINITFCMITAGSDVGQHNRTYTLARPKSMILILFVTLLTQRMFSG